MWTIVMFVLSCLSLILVLGIVMVLVLADRHASKRKDLIHRKSDAGVGTNQGASSCHFCGGMWYRQSPSVIGSTPSLSENHESLHLRDQLLQTIEQLVVFMKNTFQRSIGRQKVIHGKGEIGKHFQSLGSFFSSSTSSSQTRVSGSLSLGSAATMPKSPAQILLKNPSEPGSTVSSPARGCAAGVSGEFGSSSSLPGSLMTAGLSGLVTGSTVESESLHDKSNADSNPKLAPLRRLVLEVLMSPSVSTGGEGQDSGPSVSSGLRLKLETNATLKHLASFSHPSCSGSSYQTGETDIKEASGARLVCLPIETVPIEYGEKKALSVSPAICGSYHLSDTGINCLDVWSAESSAATGASRECAHERQTLSSNCSGHFCDKVCNACGFGCVASSLSMGSLSMAKIKQSGHNGNAKLSISSPPAINYSDTDIELRLRAAMKDDCFLHTEKPSVFSIDSLGSLHITLLKADTKSDVPEEDTSKLQVSSLLAALNVKSVACKSGGSSSSSISDEMPKGLTKNLQTSIQNSSTVVSEALQEDRPSSSSLDAAEEPLGVACCRSCNDDAGSKKKEKKKRKNKAKKQKGKEGVSFAQERQEICKIALEAVRHASGVPEREIGCVCGSVKGGFHSTNCPYPFTSSGSMLQRRIKEQYDELVKSNSAKTLTLAQVGRFTTCLVEAKSSLQQKSELIQRRFTIAKSLLSKADKSSFDRLCGQIYGLEMEQKKLEEDTVVYNRLQEQLKLSPAYKKMLEYGRAHFEVQPHTGQMIEKLEPDDTEISFEELLAQEKKDSFWQKHGLPRSSISVGG